MKNLLLFAGFLLASFFASGQSFEKGNLVGFHVLTFDFQPGITENQLVKYMLDVYIPATNKAYNTRTYLLKGVRGEFVNKLAFLWVFKNDAARDLYYNKDGTDTPEGKAAVESLKSADDGLNKYITNTSDIYNDYLILNGKASNLIKGTLIGLHNGLPALNPGVTIDQYVDEYIARAIPVYDTYMGMHANLSRVIRGNNPNSLGYFAIFPDEKTRDQFFIGDGADQKLKDANSHIHPVLDILDQKYGKWETVFTDWIVL